MSGQAGGSAGPVGANGQPFTWADCSPADFDKRRAARGHKSTGGQGALFAVPTPERERKAGPVREELPGQLDIFGGEQA